ncbi:MAG: ATP-binding protein [Ilumatobacteraceae bacterium]
MRARWRSSVRSRATIGASLVLVAALLVGAFAAAGLLRRALASDAQSQLVDRVDGVQTLIAGGLLSPVVASTGREVGQLQVVDASGHVVAVTPGLAGTTRLDVINAPPVGDETKTTIDGSAIGGVAGQDYRMVARTVPSSVGPLTIYAVTSLDASRRAERYLRNSLLIGLPLLVAFAALLISRVVARALAPVDAMRAEVDRIEAADLSGRVQAGSSDDEIANLGLTLNRMLDRLEEASTRQQLFAAAASHELRSPLSTLRTELEVGLAYPDRAEWAKVAEDSLIEVARLEELTRDLRLLTRSRSMQVAAIVPIELADLVAAEVALRRPRRAIAYSTSLERVSIPADPDAVVRVIRNLLDNAERHGATGIRVSVSANENGARLSVMNDGPPIPASEHERIFEPFMRLDEARSLDIGGSGLGLAIARTIMTALGGSIVAVPVENGAEFVVTFPAQNVTTI